MKERILRFPSGAKIVFESDLDERDGYAIYIWPEDLIDETAEFTEEDWKYLLERVNGSDKSN